MLPFSHILVLIAVMTADASADEGPRFPTHGDFWPQMVATTADGGTAEASGRLSTVPWGSGQTTWVAAVPVADHQAFIVGLFEATATGLDRIALSQSIPVECPEGMTGIDGVQILLEPLEIAPGVQAIQLNASSSHGGRSWALIHSWRFLFVRAGAELRLVAAIPIQRTLQQQTEDGDRVDETQRSTLRLGKKTRGFFDLHVVSEAGRSRRLRWNGSAYAD